MGTLRNDACYSPADLHVQVHAGSGTNSYGRTAHKRPPHRWSLAIDGIYVRSDLLDVTSLVAASLGPARRLARNHSPKYRDRKLLGTELLGRLSGGCGRCSASRGCSISRKAAAYRLRNRCRSGLNNTRQ